MTFVAIFSILVGILMIGQWIFSLATRQVPEMATEPVAITFHLVAEFLTAAALLLGGIALLAQSLLGYPLALLAQGMLLYTIINSPGYFAQRKQWPMVILLAILLVLNIVSIFILIGSLGDLITIG